MIFVWIDLNIAREYSPGSTTVGLQIKGQRPDKLLLDEEDVRWISREYNNGDRYKAHLLDALAIPNVNNIIALGRRR